MRTKRSTQATGDACSYPADSPHDGGRRFFLKRLGALVGGFSIVGSTGAILESCGADSTLPTGIKPGNTATFITISIATLVADGMSLVTTDVGPDGASIIVFRQRSDVYLSHSMKCTHQGCHLGGPSSGVMTCPCHQSRFDLTGNVLRGPAEFSLAPYMSVFDAATNTLTIKFK